MEKPSGILWQAIAKESEKPKRILDEEVRYVIIPSGMLWIINPIIERIPIQYKEGVEEKKRDRKKERKKPTKKNKRRTNHFPWNIRKYEKPSGIKSNKEIEIITPAENDRTAPITFLGWSLPKKVRR